jgi:hypothetical protein
MALRKGTFVQRSWNRPKAQGFELQKRIAMIKSLARTGHDGTSLRSEDGGMRADLPGEGYPGAAGTVLSCNGCSNISIKEMFWSSGSWDRLSRSLWDVINPKRIAGCEKVVRCGLG